MAITNVSVFRSTDGGAVSGVNGRCSGTIGDGIALLNQLLLNGYNWQEVTNANLTNSGSVGTISLTNHGFNIDQRLWLVGMDQAGYKDGSTHGDATYLTSVPDPNTITFPTTGGPTSPATTGGGAGGTTTTLNGAISSTSATSVPVVDGVTHYPGSTSFVVKVDSEYMLVTAGMGTSTWTVRRGMFGSAAATHLTGATVTQKIIIGVAPAGGATPWTSPFTTTNKASYLKPGGNQIPLDVDDTAAQTCGVRGWLTMTANNTGTGEFPTTAQLAAGLQSFCKSSAASTAARVWVAIASDRMLHLYIDSQNAGINPTTSDYLGFFDLISATKTGDAVDTMLIANSSATTGGGSGAMSVVATTTVIGHYIAQPFTQTGSSLQVAKFQLDGRASGMATSGVGGLTFPHPEDGGLYLSPLAVNDGYAAAWRGIIPGLWFVMHSKPSVHLDSVPGTGSYAGKKFMMLSCTGSGQVAFEISNTIQGT
jgi:hypothetical protein